MTVITFQPARRPGGVLPYALYVTDDARVGRQDHWAGRVIRVVGFSDCPTPSGIDVYWRDVVDNPELAVGKYMVTGDKDDRRATHQSPIHSVEVSDGTPGMLAPDLADIKAGRRVQCKDGRIGTLVSGRRNPGKNRVVFDDAPDKVEHVRRHEMWLI